VPGLKQEPRSLAATRAAAAGAVIGIAALACVVAVLATSSGGRPPPTPAGDGPTAREPADVAALERLGLTRQVPRLVSKACAEARRLAKTRVVCPELIPDIPLTRSPGLWGSIVFDAEPRVYMVSFNNAGGFEGRPLTGVEHWITGGGEAAAVARWILTDAANEVEGDPILVRSFRREGRVVHLYRFPHYPAGGVNGDHWAAFVPAGEQLLFASLHGKRFADAAVAMALDLARQATA